MILHFQIQVAEVSSLCRVTGHSIEDGARRSSAIQERLRVEPLLLHFEGSWLWQLLQIPPGCLLWEVLQARPRTCLRDSVSSFTQQTWWRCLWRGKSGSLWPRWSERWQYNSTFIVVSGLIQNFLVITTTNHCGFTLEPHSPTHSYTELQIRWQKRVKSPNQLSEWGN